MNKLNKILLIIILALVLILGTTFTVLYLKGKNKPSQTVELTSRSIIEKISDQYFIVTKTMVIDQKSTIKVDQGSNWSNFLWGQTINAQGMIRVDIGVDLSKITENDIEINEANKTIKIKVPSATILDASQFGDIEVDSKQGVLKFLLNNNPNSDHNQALAQLVKDAEATALTDQKVFDEARNSSVKLIEVILKDFDYKVEITE